MAALINSAILATGSLAIALPLGTLLAVFIARYNVAGRRTAAAALGLLLFLPLYVQLCGWDAALGKLGWFTILHGSLAQAFLSGMRGAIFVHGLAAVPWVALIVGIGLTQVPAAQEEAALLVFPPRMVLWRITLPEAWPFVLAAAMWTIVSTTSEMTVTNIYLINPRDWTLTERFYMQMAAGDAAQATATVLPGAAMLALVVLSTLVVAFRVAGRRRLSPLAPPLTFHLGRWRVVASAAVWAIVLILVGVPIASLISKAGFVVVHDGAERYPTWSLVTCLHEIARVPVRFRNELLGTVAVAVSAASVAMLAGCIFAWAVRRSRWVGVLAVSVIVLGLMIPGPLVGAALIMLLNHDLPPAIPLGDGTAKSWLLILYDNTPLAPIIAQAIRALPLAILLLWYSFSILDRDVLDAAALDGLSPMRVFWRVALPQRWRAVVAAWLAAFAIAAGDLAWSQLVTPPGLDLLSRRVFGLVHSGVEEQVAAISLVNIIVYSALAAAVLTLLRSPTTKTNR
jgi:iron(III) transport system permease protein